MWELSEHQFKSTAEQLVLQGGLGEALMQGQQPIKFARRAFADTEGGCGQIEKDDCGTDDGVYQRR